MKNLLIGASIMVLLSSMVISDHTKYSTTDIIKEVVDGVEREFIVYTPPSCLSSKEKRPIVIMFHGGGGTGKKFYNTSGWKELGDQEGFISVFPTALENCVIKDEVETTDRYWTTSNKMDQACEGAVFKDDVIFVDFILDYLIRKYNADENSIYAAGFSNGMGFINTRLLPERSEKFAAMGGAGVLLGESYTSSNVRIPFFSIAGSEDTRITKHNNNLSLPISEQDFYDNSAMHGFLKNYLNTFSLKDIPRSRETKRKLTLEYDKSSEPDAKIFRISILKDLEHKWPIGNVPSQGFYGAELLWDFFKKHG